MAKKEIKGNTAAPGIKGTSTTKATTSTTASNSTKKKNTDTWLENQSPYLQAFVKAKESGASEEQAREAGRTAKYGEGGFEKLMAEKTANSAISKGLADGSVIRNNGRFELSPAAQYAERVAATQAQNAWAQQAKAGTEKLLEENGGSRARNAYGGWVAGQMADYFGAAGNIAASIADKIGSERLAGWADKRINEADALRYASQAQTEASKEGLGNFGKLVVDASQSLLDVTGDTALAFVTGGAGTVASTGAFVTRAYGAGAAEARANGADVEKQNVAGLKSATIEYLTERIAGPFEKAYGKSIIGDATDRALAKAMKNPVARFAIKEVANFTGEAFEEVLGGVLNPLADRILQLDDGTGRWIDNIDWEESLYEGLVGGLVGLAGGAVSVDTYRDTDYAPFQGDSQKAIQAAKDAGNARLATRYENSIGENGTLTNKQAERLLGKKSAEQAYANAMIQEIRTNEAQEQKKTQTQQKVEDAFKGTPAENEDHTATYNKAEEKASFNGGSQNVSMFRGKDDAGNDSNMIRLTEDDGRKVEMTVKEAMDSDALSDNARTFIKHLSILGSAAPAAYEAYDGKLSGGEYAQAMSEAINLYAANGANLQEVVKKGGENVGISKLSEAQLAIAQDFGSKIYQQKSVDAQELSTKYKAQVEAVKNADTTTSKDLTKIDQSIAEVKGLIQKKQGDLIEVISRLENMDQDTDEYEYLMAEANDYADYIEGAKQALTDLEQARKEAEQKKPEQRRKGTVSLAGDEKRDETHKAVNEEDLTKSQKASLEAIKAFADLFPVDITVYEKETGSYVDEKGVTHRTNTFGYLVNGKLYVNILAGKNGTSIAIETLSHELTHLLQSEAPAEYRALQNEILKIYFENDPVALEKRVEEYKNRFNLSKEDALDEVIANSCTKMLNDSDAIQRLARDNMTLAQKIADIINQILDKIKKAYASIKESFFEEEKFYQQHIDQFEHARKLWADAMETASENINAGIKISADEGGTKFMAWEEQQEMEDEGIIVSSGPSAKNKVGLSTVLSKHIDELSEMKPVARLTGKEMNDRRKKLSEQILDFFDSFGNYIERTGFGKVHFGDYGMGGILNHKPLNRAKVVTISAVPAVIEHGKKIGYSANWKGRGYASYTFAAPVDIAGKTVYVATAVDVRGENEFYVNECVDSEGNYIRISAGSSAYTKSGVTDNGITSPAEEPALDANISQNQQKSKDKSAKNSQEPYKVRNQKWDNKDQIDEEISRLQDQIAETYSQEESIRSNPEYRAAQDAVYDAVDFREKVEARRALKAVKEKLGYTNYEEQRQSLLDEIKQLKEERKKYISVPEISEQDYQKLISHFGTTKDYSKAGFILKTGEVLDFSGEKQNRDYAGGREIYHNEVGDVIDIGGDTGPRVAMVNNGNVRLAPEIGGINISKMPTAKQIDGIRDFIEYNEGNVKVDIDDIGGDTIESFEYYRGTSASKVISDIRKYFSGENVSNDQSTVSQFHTMYQKWVEGQMSMDEWQQESQTETQENEEPDFRQFDMSAMTVKERRATGERLVNAVKKLFDRIPEYELKPTAEEIEWDLEFDEYASGEQGVIGMDAENTLWDISNAVKNGLIDEETGYWVMAAIVQNTNYAVKNDWINKFNKYSKVGDEDFYQWYLWNADDDEGIRYQRWTDEDEYTNDEMRSARAADARIAEENILLGNTIEDLTKEVRKLADESANRADTIDKLRRELKETKTPEAREKDAEKLARKLISKVGSDANIDEVTAEIKGMADYVIQNVGSDIDPDVLTQKAREIASYLVDQARDTIEPTADADVLTEIKKTLKGKRMYIAPEARSDLDVVNGYNRFRTRNMSRFTLVNDRTAQGVDSVYMELQSMYGEHYFPEMNSEGEMLMVMADIFDTATTQVVNPYKNDRAQIIREVANDIYYGVLSDEIRQMPATMADKLKAAEDQLKYERRELSKAEKAGEKQDAKIEKLQEKVDVLKGAQTMANRLSKAIEKQTAKYEKLLAKKDERISTVREQGKARIEQARAKEKAAKWEKVKELREYYQEKERRAAERRRESAGFGKYRRQVIEKAAKLTNLLIENSDKRHVPEPLKKPLAEFLESINFDSARKLAGGEDTQADNRFAVTAVKLKNILENQQKYLNGEEGTDPEYGFGGYIDIAPDALQTLKDMSDEVLEAMDTGRSYTVNEMSAEELKNLSNVLSALYSGIRNMNSFMANERYESVREAADADIEHLAKLGKAKDSEGNLVKRFLKWQDATPYYAMKRFGEGGEAIFEGLTKGWEKMAMNVKEIIEFTQDAYTTEEVNAWKNDIRNIKLEDGSEIRMSVAQIMAFSQLLSREQALKHMEHGGVRIGNIQGKKGEIVDTAHYHFSEADIQNLLKILNDRQMEVATKLRKYMGKRGGELGNEISERRFGYDFFTEGESYFPIATDSNDRPMADTDAKSNDMFRLLNLGATKSLNPHASNALVVNDIFDVFADHMADMAKYNGMGLSILDAIKWFNFKERMDNEDGTYDVRSLQSAIETAFGTPAGKYFRTLMKDINGVHEGGDRASGVRGLLTSNYKVAAVAANLRVALLQPTAYARASAVIKPKYLMAAFSRKNASEEALKYSGTAQWKDLGFYDTNISRNMREQIEHADTWKDKLIEASMKGAEIGDSRTWGRLWVAAKMQVQAEHPRIKGKELIQKTTDLFRETIYASQVMDSTLTRSELMRSSAFGDKAITAFMAEPTLSYNLLLDAYSDYQLDSRENGKEGALKRNAPKLKKAFAVYAASATFSAIMESFVDAMRDSDDEDFWQKFLQAFFGEGDNFIKKFYDGNLGSDFSLIAKIPLAKNLISFIQGYNDSDMSTEGLANLINAFNVWKETIELQTGALEEPTKVTYYGRMTDWGKIYKTLQAVSMLTGLPVSAGARDALAIWNTTVGGVYPEIKVKTYDDNALSGSQAAAYKEFVKPTGMKERQYKKVLAEADAAGDGNGSVKQDELGTYLMQAEATGELTDAEIYAIWASKGWKTSYQEWKAKQ